MMWRATHASCAQGRLLDAHTLEHMNSQTCFLHQGSKLGRNDSGAKG